MENHNFSYSNCIWRPHSGVSVGILA